MSAVRYLPVMSADKSSRFINVYKLMPQVTLEQVAAFYGMQLPELNRVGSETRVRCFLNCGRSQDTGDRAIAIQADHPAKQWHCHQYGCGKSGGTMQGTIVYPLLSEQGEVLTWFGRDPSFEEKHGEWETSGREAREPEKFHFVKGFHRGVELFGQHVGRLDDPGCRDFLQQFGLIVVEGPNDVIALDCLGVPGVGLCSNAVTKEQVEKLTTLARVCARGRIVLLLDCDSPGEIGAKDALWLLAQHCDVRLGWSGASHGGRFRGRQPESLSAEDWRMIRDSL